MGQPIAAALPGRLRGRRQPGRRPPRLSVWPPLTPEVYLRRPLPRLPYPLEEPSCQLVAWARHGIWHGVRALGLEVGDEILVPAYHHGSEVEALVRAGMRCRFYECDEMLRPDPEALGRLLRPQVRALYLIHYAGFPQDAPAWRRWCDERGLALVEDAAQAWLATIDDRPLGSWGDLAVFCLYKTIGLAEGALAVACGRPAGGAAPDVPLDPRPGLRELAVQHATWLAGRSGAFYAAARRRRPAPPYDPVRDFELRDPGVGPWATTRFLLRRLADPSIAAQRRAHYARLLDGLGDLVPLPFSSLPAGASPFMFPIVTDGKAQLAAALRRRGVVALDPWAVAHPSLPAEAFPAAARRRASTLGLPVHQELRPEDLDRLVTAVRAAQTS